MNVGNDGDEDDNVFCFLDYLTLQYDNVFCFLDYLTSQCQAKWDDEDDYCCEDEDVVYVEKKIVITLITTVYGGGIVKLGFRFTCTVESFFNLQIGLYPILPQYIMFLWET